MGILQDGEIIRETYEVERHLGDGAFAEVYRVKHRFLGRQAMKVFKVAGMTLGETEQLLGEALLLSRIGHPNIIRVFDANTMETAQGMRGFFTMEYVAGGSLDQFWRSFGGRLMPVETVIDVMTQVCRGLSVAHAETPPIVHRDVKPQNILVGYDASGLRARISDFGLAKQVNPLTLLASAQGTRGFKAPETFSDFNADSCAGDVWAIGCTFYLLLTDRLPYSSSEAIGIEGDGRFEQPLIPPSRYNIQVDPTLDSIITRSLAVRPDQRFATARQLLDELTGWHPNPARTTGAQQAGSKAEVGGLFRTDGPADEAHGRAMVAKALELSRSAGALLEAADLLEEALNRWPSLRTQHESRLTLWRRGIAM